MNLNFKTFGHGPALVILHGLFGSLDNWVTHARELEKDFSVYLVDQRNHGKSPHSPDISYRLMAEDLYTFMENEGIYSAHLLGHSMGGKTVMEFAGLYPDHVDKLIVADMGVRAYPPHHVEILATLESMELHTFDSRKAVEIYMMERLKDNVTVQFLLKGLGRDANNQFEWKFNLPAILQKYTNILAAVQPDTFYKPTLFLTGGNSHYVEPEDHNQILAYFPQASFTVMPNTGHWVHAENPPLFLQIVKDFLN